MNAKKSFYSALVLTLVLASAAMAQDRPWNMTIELTPTAAGDVADAKGLATIGIVNGVQTFAARLNAPLRDGTVIVVKVQKGEDRPQTVGSFIMRLGSGVLELNSSVNPSYVFPVGKLGTLELHLDGVCLVEGRFF